MRPIKESEARTLDALRRWSVVLDTALRVPGTDVRFGLDPILGLIPGLGDLATPFFSAILLLHAVRLRTPRVVQLRMLLNSVIDLGIGAIPLVGDLADFGWKANVRNLALLERHARPGSTAPRGDWIFVVGVISALVVLALVPIILSIWLLSRVNWI